MCARVCVQGRKQVCRSLLFIAFHCFSLQEEEAAQALQEEEEAAQALLFIAGGAGCVAGAGCAGIAFHCRRSRLRCRSRLRRHCFSLQEEESASMLHA